MASKIFTMRFLCILHFKLLHLFILFDRKTPTMGLHNETTNELNVSVHNGGKQNVLLISFDGFRWDYLDLVDAPVLNSFKKLGVSAKYVKNVVPTLTFPNHVTLATGLYPESHGIVANEMYDPLLKSYFNMTITDPKWWWNSRVQPIWYTNEKQGGVSGVCYWPGFNIKGYRPSFYADKEGKYIVPYHGEKNLMPYKERVDNVMKWLQHDNPPNFLMLYFGQLDLVGHKCGYGSSESLLEVSKLDNITGYLLDQLSAHGLLDKWNIIITGDHGMTNLSLNRVIDLDNYLNSSDYTVVGGDGIVCIWPRGGNVQQIFNKIKNAHPNMTVYLKEGIPESLHFHYNHRISPIVLVLDEGWMLNAMPHYPFNEADFYLGGHGFLNTLTSMWPLFLARGPAFKKGYFSAPFQSIDIYSLVCKILGIRAQPNNGSQSAIWPLLSEELTAATSFSPVLVGVLVASLFVLFGILLFVITMCISKRKMKKFKRRQWHTKIVMSELEQTNAPLLRSSDDDEEDFTDEHL